MTIFTVIAFVVIAVGNTVGLVMSHRVVYGVLFGVVGPAVTLVEWREQRAKGKLAAESADRMLIMVYCAMMGLSIVALE